MMWWGEEEEDVDVDVDVDMDMDYDDEEEEEEEEHGSSISWLWAVSFFSWIVVASQMQEMRDWLLVSPRFQV